MPNCKGKTGGGVVNFYFWAEFTTHFNLLCTFLQGLTLKKIPSFIMDLHNFQPPSPSPHLVT